MVIAHKLLKWQVWDDHGIFACTLIMNMKWQEYNTLIEMARYDSWEFLGKGSRPRGAGIRCYLKGLFEPRHHLRVYMNKIKESMPLGLTRGFSTIWKIYLNPWSQIGLKWDNNRFGNGFQCLFGLTWGFSTIWKIYLNPRSRIGLKWEKSFWKWVSMPFRAYTGV